MYSTGLKGQGHFKNRRRFKNKFHEELSALTHRVCWDLGNGALTSEFARRGQLCRLAG